ncbi:hypothetical protein AGMMS49531_01080 [Endomicrobiia bacterium]|nr:hypothetical protein AGMMS49531_01080 [Endomicrobiia bacterium]
MCHLIHVTIALVCIFICIAQALKLELYLLELLDEELIELAVKFFSSLSSFVGQDLGYFIGGDGGDGVSMSSVFSGSFLMSL